MRAAERLRRALVAIGSASLLVVAPFQCPSSPDPSQVREDSPGEALYALAGELGKANDKEGQVRALRFIIERYPRSRFATQAATDLKALGVDPPEPVVPADPSKEGVPLGRLPGDPSASAAPAGSAPPAVAPKASE